jgi:hypothetical protein
MLFQIFSHFTHLSADPHFNTRGYSVNVTLLALEVVCSIRASGSEEHRVTLPALGASTVPGSWAMGEVGMGSSSQGVSWLNLIYFVQYCGSFTNVTVSYPPGMALGPSSYLDLRLPEPVNLTLTGVTSIGHKNLVNALVLRNASFPDLVTTAETNNGLHFASIRGWWTFHLLPMESLCAPMINQQSGTTLYILRCSPGRWCCGVD